MATASATSSNDKINNLQLIRAVAALLVAYVHTKYSLGGLRPFGTFGVDIFFVLSGFIMASICGRNPDAFFLRRLIRIVPPYWSFTLLVFAVALVAPALLNSTETNPVHLAKSLFFIPFRKSNGAMQPLLFLGWTLNYEMFFYAIVSLSLAISRRYALPIASLILVGCMVACHPFRGRNDLAEFYSNPKMLEFILGILSFQIYARYNSRSWPLRIVNAACVLGAMGLLIAIEGVGVARLGLPGGVAGLPPSSVGRVATGLMAFVLVLSTSLLSKSGIDARPGVLVLIGDASYILYLVHPYIEIGLAKLIGKRLPTFSPETSLVAVALVMAAATYAAVVIHLYVERPVTRSLSRRLSRKKARPAAASPAPGDHAVPNRS